MTTDVTLKEAVIEQRRAMRRFGPTERVDAAALAPGDFVVTSDGCLLQAERVAVGKRRVRIVLRNVFHANMPGQCGGLASRLVVPLSVKFARATEVPARFRRSAALTLPTPKVPPTVGVSGGGSTELSDGPHAASRDGLGAVDLPAVSAPDVSSYAGAARTVPPSHLTARHPDVAFIEGRDDVGCQTRRRYMERHDFSDERFMLGGVDVWASAYKFDVSPPQIAVHISSGGPVGSTALYLSYEDACRLRDALTTLIDSIPTGREIEVEDAEVG